LTYVKVCSMDLIPSGSVKAFHVNGKEIMVINNNGQLFCLEARCTHAGAPLAEGTIKDDILTCPWHGSKFKISNGKVIKGPAKQDLKVYKNIIKNNFLHIDFLSSN
jgi:nitrite reductase/ring-hydroxylating ferredoxin subunit